MYNRYVPQPDGSYRRSRVPDPHQQERSRKPPPPPKPDNCVPPARDFCPEPQETQKRSCPRKQQPAREGDSITGFFKHLLPKDIDTADLLIIILMLLMAGDCEEDRNNALLTLALYFFM